MKISIIIKALNEEAKIGMAVESSTAALARLAELGLLVPEEGEIVVADSISTDRTVEIASMYKVRIVQFSSIADRGCGAGAQLAFQHSLGDYVYILDGDMRLRPDFLPAALAMLDGNDDIAGVGGLVEDSDNDNMEFRTRAARNANAYKAGPTTRLDCGGLYRRSAIMQSGYFADRNLHSFEEMDLGARLIAAGWKLVRLNETAVDHFTHTTGSYQLMWKRLSSGYAMGSGEVVRGAIGSAHFWILARQLRVLRVAIFVFAWLASVLLVLVVSPNWGGLLTSLVILALPVFVMSLRRRSLRIGFYSVSAWLMNTFGFVRGFLRSRIDPKSVISSKVLKEI